MPQGSNRPVDWAELVQENENRLYRAALAILGDYQEAEDAVQDAFLRFLEKRPRDLENPGGWLMRVLINGCRSRLRLHWRRVTGLPPGLAVDGPEQKEELTELFSLPTNERVAVHLFYYEGYSTEEIARLTGVRPGTVRARLSKARAHLRVLLADVDD